MLTSAPKRRKPITIVRAAARPRQTREFVPHALQADWLVARFGHTDVTIKPAPARNIYRDTMPDVDGKRVPAGVWPGVGYEIEVHGEMSCRAATLDAAKAIAEWRALNSEANHRRASGKLLYSLTPGRAAEAMQMLDNDRAGLMAAFPFSEREQALPSVRDTPGFAEGQANERTREIHRLCGFISPFA